MNKQKKNKGRNNYTENYAPRNKVLWYLNHLIEISKNLVISLTIDETMVFFRGRSRMKFYMSVKPTKWGFKMHSLVVS